MVIVRSFTSGIKAAVVFTVLLGFSEQASAAVLKYCPSGSSTCNLSTGNPTNVSSNDLGDLDHRNFYTWRISGINLGAGQEVSGATLTFKNIYNWDGNANRLFLQLLDDARTTGGTSLVNNSYSRVRFYSDESALQGPMSDVFNNSAAIECAGKTGSALTACQSKQSSEQTQENNLVTNGTQEAALTNRSFAALGQLPTTAPGMTNPPGWTVTPDGTSNGNQLYTYTYTFTEGQEDLLQAFINNNGAIAIGLDPDCHFYNNGVLLTITTGAVPEPVTVALLGAGIAAGLYRRRRQARA
jgi:hypothetical protein